MKENGVCPPGAEGAARVARTDASGALQTTPGFVTTNAGQEPGRLDRDETSKEPAAHHFVPHGPTWRRRGMLLAIVGAGGALGALVYPEVTDRRQEPDALARVEATLAAIPWDDPRIDVPCDADECTLSGRATMRLVRIPAGSFMMGGDESDPVHDLDESPSHGAHVAEFLMCRTEVTRAQWAAVMEKRTGDQKWFDPATGVGDDLPVHAVEWSQAVEFMNALTEEENSHRNPGFELTPCYRRAEVGWEWAPRDCTGFRLPTETEWEYAVRAGTRGAVHFSADERLVDYAWYRDNSARRFWPVATKKPNSWGIHDMYGNVAEWVWDWYADYPADATEAGYAGPPWSAAGLKIVRGGAFSWNADGIRSPDRHVVLAIKPGGAEYDAGVRCARSLEAPASR